MNYNFKIINYEFRIPVAKVLNKLIYTNYSYSAIYVIFISDKKEASPQPSPEEREKRDTMVINQLQNKLCPLSHGEGWGEAG